LGIDLEPSIGAVGVTPNDAKDPDGGPNNLQNYPTLTNVTWANGKVTLGGTFNSTPGATFVIDFYRSAAPNASGFGEGEVYLGSVSVVTRAAGRLAGHAAIAASFPAPADVAGQYFTATASRDYGAGTYETSEFSRALLAPTP
jgi:hypothetical protein